MNKSRRILIAMMLCLLLADLKTLGQSTISIGVPDTISLSIKTGGYATRSVYLTNHEAGTLFYSVSGKYRTNPTEINYAIEFDGIDDFVDCGNLGLGDSIDEITVECWIKPDSLAGDQGVWEFYGNTLAEFRFGIFSGSYSLLADKSEEGGWIYYNAKVTNEWVHVAVSYDGKFIRVYENGTHIGSTPMTAHLDLKRLFYIGTKDQKEDFATGLIDEVRVWNIVRTESEIEMDMWRELSGKEKGLTAYWNFNEGECDEAMDISGHQNTGKLMNGASYVRSTAPVLTLQWWNPSLIKDSILPHQSGSFSIEFNSKDLDAGEYLTKVCITFQGVLDSVINIPVNMHVTSAPNMVVSTDSLIYEDVYYGGKYVQKLRIINKGYQILRVDKILTDNSSFHADKRALSIDPRSKQDIDVYYQPHLFGNSSGNLLIGSNDPFNNNFTVTLESDSLKIERSDFLQWILYIILFLVLVIFILLYFRYRLQITMNRKLEMNVENELKRWLLQKQIIVHQSRLTTLGEMAAGIAHEIAVPLQNILFATEGIEIERNKSKNKTTNNEVTTLLDNIDENILKIDRLISHINTFSGSAKPEINANYSVNDIIKNIISLSSVKIARQKIRLTVDLAEQIPAAHGDPTRLEQVLINLINNARDAVNTKALTFSGEYVKEIQIRTRSQNDGYHQNSPLTKLKKEIALVIIEITDNGSGIPQEIISKIFNPFFTTKKIGKGTGLGLSISYGLIRDMNGTIDVYSQEHQGTTFKITLPV